MSRFIELMDRIYEKDRSFEKMNETTAILETMFDEMRQTHKELYEDTMHEFEEIAYEISMDKAKEIVKAMTPYGEKWDYETIKTFLKSKGITENCIEYYITQNMAINDYYDLAKYAGKEDDMEFYFQLAKDFITDEDAKPFKIAKYFL